tara:strand:+ start:9250 stop:10170 length:921 start_codon:yes stop_codon:yes gene_type:complete
LLSIDDAIVAVDESLMHRAHALAANNPRERAVGGPDVYVNTMLGIDHALGVHGFKTYTVASGVFRFFVYLYDSATSGLLAIVEANKLGQLRTGAATGVATREMANADASEVGIIGSGFQARSQLEAVTKVRPVRRARVYSPTREHRESYAHEMSHELGIDVAPVDSAKAAVEGTDIAITVTSSREPVLNGEWLEPGMHVVAAGGADPYVREIDDLTVQRADLIVVDDKAQAQIEAGELMMPSGRGLVLWEQMRELWQIVSGEVTARTAPGDITLFKSLGMTLWDIAAAKIVYDRAVETGVGRSLPE